MVLNADERWQASGFSRLRSVQRPAALPPGMRSKAALKVLATGLSSLTARQDTPHENAEDAEALH